MNEKLNQLKEYLLSQGSMANGEKGLPGGTGGKAVSDRGDHELLGFIAVDVPSKNFLGPIGVLPSERHKGIAKALDLTGMKALRAKGYQYAISGMVHPWGRRLDEEITKLIPIPDSAGSYGDML